MMLYELKKAIPLVILAFVALGAPLVLARTSGQFPQHCGMMGGGGPHHLQMHMTQLRDVLILTPQQSEQWKSVVQTIEDNDKSLNDLLRRKNLKSDTQSAVDNLMFYGEMAEARSAAVKKTANVFATFYAGLSDSQKTEADEFFRSHNNRCLF
jgi:LTXXQ motif family protein